MRLIITDPAGDVWGRLEPEASEDIRALEQSAARGDILGLGLLGVSHVRHRVARSSLRSAGGGAVRHRGGAVGARRGRRTPAGKRTLRRAALGEKAGILVAVVMLLLVYRVALRPPTGWDATMYP